MNMNQIYDPPKDRNFGLDFNYASWNANTVITLTNVPWDNNYRDIVKFESEAALNTYLDLDSTNTRIEGMSYAKVNTPVRLNIPFNKAYKYNYLRAHNPAQPIPGSDEARNYYYFIVDVQYIAPNTTQVIVQLDIWQTFGKDVTFGNCFVERGHIGIANGNQFRNHGRDYLTVPEGLDVGGEYRVVAKRSKAIMSNANEDPTNFDGMFAVLVASTTDLTAATGDQYDPKLVTAKGGPAFGLPAGASYYVFQNGNAFQNYLMLMQDKPWVTQGIISIKLIPDVKRYYEGFEYADGGLEPADYLVAAPPAGPLPLVYSMYADWRNSQEIYDAIPAEYRHLRKLWTYPYMVVELTTWNGTPVILKPDSWNNSNADLIELATFIAPAERISISPRSYNALTDNNIDARYPGFPVAQFPRNQGDDNGEYLDITTQIANFPTMAIVNNGAIGYMAANSQSIPQQYRNSEWSQQKAMAGAQASYDNASSGMDLTQAMNEASTYMDQAQSINNQNMQREVTGTNMVSGVVSGGAGGALAGGPGGAIAGLSGGGISAVTQGMNLVSQMATTEANRAARMHGASRQLAGQLTAQGNIRDTNKSLADFSAKGDYFNTIMTISARVQDAQLTQPSVSGQQGGETMALVHNDIKVSVRIKMIDYAAIRRIGDFWHRYGYAVNTFVKMPVSLMTNENFTYWKLSEVYLVSGDMPQTFKGAIRGIFEKGVTVWRDPDKMGQVNIGDNPVIGGIAF
jgi:hypothetical protein